MKNKIKKIIQENTETNILWVLKGFSVSILDIEIVNIDQIIANKLGRLMQVVQMKKPVISYDEFICIYDLVIAQFSKIYIIEDPFYWNFYPLQVEIEDAISQRLLDHFDPEKEEDTEIGEILEYTNIYRNFIQTSRGIACCYNLEKSKLEHEKIAKIKMNVVPAALELTEEISNHQYMNLYNDIDFFELVQKLYSDDDVYALTWQNNMIDKQTIQKKLEILNGAFEKRIFALIEKKEQKEVHLDPEVIKIMKQYWGKDSTFRDIKMYDLNALEEHQKEVILVSQKQIVGELIEQAENCLKGEHFRDAFVTAPTGSGKSLMFQLPAMYLAEKYGIMTLVITPLIGLMNDQMQSLEKMGYPYARTIHSDISPNMKQEIFRDISENKCHILYLSPESLLSRSDIEQLIGTRKIGMLVVDEAHIVTTWGKQFRPDYWFLGDHVHKLRKNQSKRENDPSPFIIAAFTATAVYEGHEDMYHETINSLHMADPITYLGYVKRENIKIDVSEVQSKKNRTEYEMDKFDSLIDMMNTALMRNQKMLIYFPTVALIMRFYDYCCSKELKNYVARYNGQMNAAEKNEEFLAFSSGVKPVMIATKAFGMGIDIPDIEIVAHFAPTGNVCDYMQEIGRAARDPEIQGYAIYKHMKNDFKHINQLHGLSTIKKYQLIEVMKKILELYNKMRYNDRDNKIRKKRNELMIDTDSFAYIFRGPLVDENSLFNRVKTAMLMIQKDYENRGFAPFYMRPLPSYAMCFFAASPEVQKKLNRKYRGSVELLHSGLNVCRIDLKKIWRGVYENEFSFPKFKYLIYTKSPELDFNEQYPLTAAMSIDVFFEDDHERIFSVILNHIKQIIMESIYQGEYISMDSMIKHLSGSCKISSYRSEHILNVLIASMDTYRKEYSRNTGLYYARATETTKKYKFSTSVNQFFGWVQKKYRFIMQHIIEDHKLYLINDTGSVQSKEVITILGLLESFGVLRFQSIGGSNSQIYIYVNETKTMQIVRDTPSFYKNRILDMVEQRHKQSVQMLSFLFENEFTSDEIWEHLENYFLGILPPELDTIDQ